MRIVVTVVGDDGVGSREIDALAAGARRKQKQKRIALRRKTQYANGNDADKDKYQITKVEKI